MYNLIIVDFSWNLQFYETKADGPLTEHRPILYTLQYSRYSIYVTKHNLLYKMFRTYSLSKHTLNYFQPSGDFVCAYTLLSILPMYKQSCPPAPWYFHTPLHTHSTNLSLDYDKVRQVLSEYRDSVLLTLILYAVYDKFEGLFIKIGE